MSDERIEVSERWRRPVKVYAVSEDVEAYDTEIGPNGVEHLVRATKFVVDDEGMARLKLGYACLRCMEPFENPFPERCPLCSYAVRENQAHDLEGSDRGGTHVGPATTLEEERERMMDDADRRRHKKGSSIIVPGRG